MYETHITVRESVTLESARVFNEICKCRGLKALFIQLSHGKHRNQLMAGLKSSAEDEQQVCLDAGFLAGEFHRSGWAVQRIKVESTLCPGLNRYFESHWKLQADTPIDVLDRLCSSSLRWSKNVLTGHYYLTARSYDLDDRNAADFFDKLHQGISNQLTVLAVHSERVILDTNPGLDQGWMDERIAAAAKA
jgi:hypothetical protein